MRSIAIALGLLALSTAARAEWNSLIGQKAPPVKVKKWINPAEGEALEDLQGKVVLLEFWATW